MRHVCAVKFVASAAIEFCCCCWAVYPELHCYLCHRRWKEIVFTPICLSGCLSVCVQDISKSCGLIRMKFSVQVWVTRTNWLDFGEDPDPHLDLTKRIFHHWEIGLKTIYSTISQKVGDRFGWNLVDRLGVWQGQIYSILVKIRIRIWIRELFNF